MTSLPAAPSAIPRTAPPRVVTARNGVAVVFALNGLAVASWFARVPTARQELGLPAGRLGLLLLAMSGGAVLALSTAGALSHRWGTGRVALGGTMLLTVGLVVVGLGIGSWQSVPVVAIGLFAIGYGSGTTDVSINVEGAAVERALGWTVMPRFHAAWSIGTVTGAALGAISSRIGLPIAVHLAVIAAIVLVGTAIGTRYFLPAELVADVIALDVIALDVIALEVIALEVIALDSMALEGPALGTTAQNKAEIKRENKPESKAAAGKRGGSGALEAWLEPRTLLIGLLVLVVAFTEGTANDWLAVAFVDGHKVSDATGAVIFGIFVTAMTTGRTLGPSALDRWGRVRVLLSTMLLAAIGSVIAVLAGSLTLALVGVALWGLGASLGFPVGMSAAADDETRAAARVSVVAVLGYTAFLAGPPLVGFLGNHYGVLRALLIVPVLLIPALALVPAARPLAPAAEHD